MSTRFRKKPVVIEAMQWHGEPKTKLRDIQSFMGAKSLDYVGTDRGGILEAHTIVINTLEGCMKCVPGDWIIKGVSGEFYPCKPDVFAKTYEAEECPSEVARLRETVKRLNRRCQQAEAAITEAEHVLRIAPDEKGVRWVRGSLGRALLGERCRRLEEEVQALKIERGMLITMLRRARAWGISGLGYCSRVAIDIAAWVDGGMKFPPPALPEHLKETVIAEEAARNA